jgi:hypothetical protein
VTGNLDACLAHAMTGRFLVALGVDEVAFAQAEDGAVGEEMVQVGVRVSGGLLGAVRDVESVEGLRATGAGQEDLVSMLDIAHRTKRSREAVRLWAVGKRGPGGAEAQRILKAAPDATRSQLAPLLQAC